MNTNIALFSEWIIFLIGLLGAVLGSFFNACIDRLFDRSSNASHRVIPQGWKAMMIPARSFCFECGMMISWHDNIPVLSYVFLRGKCRHCLTSYGIRSFLIELCFLFLFVVLGILLTKKV